MKLTPRLRVLLICCGSSLLTTPAAFAQSGNWNIATGGNWSTAANWNPAAIPGNAAGDIIGLNNDITANSIVTINTAPRTAGILNIGDSNNSHAFTLAASGGGTLTLNNGGSGAQINEAGSIADTISAPVILADNLTTNVAGTLNFTGVISQTGGVRSITKIGAGALTLNGANTFSGGVALSAGTIYASNNASFGTGTLTINGGRIDIALNPSSAGTTITTTNANTWNTSWTLGRGTTGTGTWNNNGDVQLGGNITVSGANNSSVLNLGGVVSETGGSRSLTLAGTGLTITLSGANTYSGGTNTGGHRLNINSSGSGGTSSAIGTGTLTIAGGIIDNTSAGLVTLSTNNAINTTGTVTFAGTRSLNLGTGAVTLNSTRTIIVTANTLTLGGAISAGAQGIVKQGAGTLALGGVNNTTGANTLTGGTLRLNHANALGGGNMKLNGGLLGLGAGNITFSNVGTAAGQVQWTNAASGFTAYGADRTVTIGAAGTSINWTATSFIGAANSLNLSSTDSDATIIFNKNISLAGGGRTVNVANGSAAIDAKLTQILTGGSAGNSPLTKAGAGTLSLTAQSTYDGNTNVTGGTLMLGDGTGNTGGLSSNSSSVVVSLGATLSVNRTGAVSQGASSALGNNAIISGAGGFTQAGSGTTTLTLANTYTGATNISAGTLAVASAGSINTTSSINVAAGAKLIFNSSTALTVSPTLNGAGTGNLAVLGGIGTINSAVTLDNLGDTLSPGNSPGIQNFTPAQTWSSFSYDWEMNDFAGATPGDDFDQIGLNSTLSLSGGSGSYILNVLGLTALDAPGMVPNFSEINRSWTILTSTGITGFNAANWTLNLAGFTDPYTGTWSLAQSGNNLVLSYAAVPEPSALVLGSLSLLALLRRRRGSSQ